MRGRIALAAFVLILCATAQATVLGDIVFSREGGTEGFPPAYFPHWVHRMQFRCYVCHDAIFKMKRGENDLSMAAMTEGKSCGTCHNGATAWRIDSESCTRCHVGQ